MNDRDFWLNEATLEHDICTMPVQPFVDMIKQELDTVGRVLDIGCGNGRLAIPVSEQMNCEVVGVDINKKFIDAAPKSKRVKYVLADSLNFRGVDAAYSILLFQHIPNEEKQKYIIETYKSLRKGGVFLFQYVEGDYKGRCCYDANINDVRSWMGKFKITNEQFDTMEKRWTWITAIK